MLGRVAFAVAVVGCLCAGCSQTGVSASDQSKVREEFSKANYEKAMKAAGKDKELAEAKKREEEFLKNSNSGSQDAGQR